MQGAGLTSLHTPLPVGFVGQEIDAAGPMQVADIILILGRVTFVVVSQSQPCNRRLLHNHSAMAPCTGEKLPVESGRVCISDPLDVSDGVVVLPEHEWRLVRLNCTDKPRPPHP